ncbi:MAG: cell division protein FtsL [Geobacter sp.]|nr:cell division protein FtsL [Geobacter sp.]
MANIRTATDKVLDPRRLESGVEHGSDLFAYALVVLAIMTLVSIFHVWSRVKVVDLNLKVGEMRKELKEQEQEQGRLKLEVASLKAPARIESIAKGELGLSLPTEQQIVVVK